MKSILLVLAIITCRLVVLVFSNQDVGNGTPYFLVDNGNGTLRVEYLLNTTIKITASESDLTFYLYTRSNTGGISFTSSEVSSLQGFNASKNSLVIVHGWHNNYGSDVNTKIKAAALSSYDINVIVVDWSPIAKENYVTAKNAVTAVGGFVGNLLRNLVSTYNISWTSITLVGHSLGAHVVGNAGASVNGTVSTIVGLDPAGPLFTIGDTDDRLDPTDGKFVQIIHTNGGVLGFEAAIGDTDYYVNGGSIQPGCTLDVTGSCSHARAYLYYAESLVTGNFYSRSCSHYLDFTQGNCASAPKSLMGGYVIDTKASGTYYLATNSESPYALGDV